MKPGDRVGHYRTVRTGKRSLIRQVEVLAVDVRSTSNNPAETVLVKALNGPIKGATYCADPKDIGR